MQKIPHELTNTHKYTNTQVKSHFEKSTPSVSNNDKWNRRKELELGLTVVASG